jgi:hypothetical protein
VYLETERRWVLASDAITSPWLKRWHVEHSVDPVRAPRPA